MSVRGFDGTYFEKDAGRPVLIQLNLTNKPGLQLIDETIQIDLEGLIPDIPPEEDESVAEPAVDVSARPKTTPQIPDIPDIPDMPEVEESPVDFGGNQIPEINDDLFKLAEANLDLIEQAEEEEFPTEKKIKAEIETEEKPARQKKEHLLLRHGILVAALVILIFVLKLYQNGTLNRESVKRTARLAAEKVTGSVAEQAAGLVQKADDLTETYTNQAGNLVRQAPGIAQDITSSVRDAAESAQDIYDARASEKVEQIVDYSQPVAPVVRNIRESTASTQRVYGSSNISGEVIQRVQVGQNKLKVAAIVLEQFPQSSKLQYLRVKNDKVSFILNVRSVEEAEHINNYFVNQRRFESPEIFYVDRNAKFDDNPVEIMAIVRFKALRPDDSKGYKYYDDRQLSQYIWQAGLQSKVQMSPFKISDNDVTSVRNAEIIGNGYTPNVIRLLNELSILRNNMALTILSIQSDTEQPLSRTILNYSLNSFIYPSNM